MHFYPSFLFHLLHFSMNIRIRSVTLPHAWNYILLHAVPFRVIWVIRAAFWRYNTVWRDSCTAASTIYRNLRSTSRGIVQSQRKIRDFLVARDRGQRAAWTFTNAIAGNVIRCFERHVPTSTTFVHKAFQSSSKDNSLRKPPKVQPMFVSST